MKTLLKTIVCTSLIISTLIHANSTTSIKITIANDLNKQKDDENFKEAIKFYTGEKGFRIVEKEFPTCPYDACKLSNDRVEQIDQEDGSRKYKIKLHDWRSAKQYFEQSVNSTNSALSAEYILFMLLERINYKDKYYDEFLMKDIKEALDINTQADYNKEIAKYLPMINAENSCRILYKSAEIYEKGYCNIPVNKDKAQELFGYAKKTCTPKSLYGVLLKNK